MENRQAFRKRFSLGGDTLKRPPEGHDPVHPLIEDLKRKDFIAYTNLTEKQACSKDFMKRLASDFRVMKPVMGFLTRAVGAPW